MDMDKYNIESSEEELFNAIKNIKAYVDRPGQHNIELGYITNLLNSKQQKKILEQQNEFNKKILGQNRSLAYATWVLAIITAIILIASFFIR